MSFRIAVCCIIILSFLITGCNNNRANEEGAEVMEPINSETDETADSVIIDGDSEPDQIVFYEEDTLRPVMPEIEGHTALTLIQGDDFILLENENIRLILNSNSGSIREIANKEIGLYLVKDAYDANPVRIVRRSGLLPTFDEFSYQILADTEDEKTVELRWNFTDNLIIISEVSLFCNASEVEFSLSLLNNQFIDTVISIEYPIIEQIGTLFEKENDYFMSPFITGYLFHNPVDNFNKDFRGINRGLGMYPSGWEYPLQFHAYYSKNIGGFLLQTKDGGNGIKSFTFTGDNNDTLRMSVHHFLCDIKDGDTRFDYNTAIINLNEGSWQAAADLYREWALRQDWVSMGRLSDRDDINNTFFENTTFVNFNFPYTHYVGRAAQTEIYDLIKNTIYGNILNVVFPVDDYVIKLSKEKEDYFMFFEFNNFYNVTGTNPEFIENAMTDISGIKVTFRVNDDWNNYFGCLANDEWLTFVLGKEERFIFLGADGFYHDVSIAAPHPKQCFNVNHSHGTFINAIRDNLRHAAAIKDLAATRTNNIYGQELIFEQLIPYLDFYQARANAGLMGWMEHDRIRPQIRTGVAEIIPLFDYVYSGYAGKRTDGFANANAEFGGMYYYVMAYTALNGGLPQYNYEDLGYNDFILADGLCQDMIDYLSELGRIKLGEGKNYLVYGTMMRAPDTGNGQEIYTFPFRNYRLNTESTESAAVDRVVTSAFEYNGKVAIFLTNITENIIEANFILKAGEFYGIQSGMVSLYENDAFLDITSITDGKADVSLELAPRKVVMLLITP